MKDLKCVDLVERVTDYLEGSLDAVGAQLADHLKICWGCERYVGEIGMILRLMSELPPERLSGDLESSLVDIYKGWVVTVRA